MHAAFVADEIWGFMPEPARSALVDRRTSGSKKNSGCWIVQNSHLEKHKNERPAAQIQR